MITTDSGKIKLTKQEYEQMKKEHDDAIVRERAALALLNRMQGLAQSAKGNLARIASEVQEYLRDTVTVESKP